MGILQFPVPIPVTNGNYPQFKFAVFSDNLATVTTAGYLNQGSIQAGIPLSNADVIMALYSFNTTTQTGTFGIFTVSIATTTGQITITQWANSGDAVLPTTANYLAHFTNTTGTISSAAGNVTQPGNIAAGLSGTAGTVASFPGTASKGSLVLAAVANTGNTNTTISNAAMGQASVVSIPDPANAVGRFLIGATATPFTSGNIPSASGTGGLMVDSGKAAASLPTFTSPTIANHFAVFTNTSGNLGEDAATAINAGNIQAGLSGTAGTLAAFPSGALAGKLVISAIGNTGNTDVTISNAIFGQASVITIPDPGSATAKFVLDTGTTTMAAGSQIVLAKADGTEAANAVTASGNAGVITTSSLTTVGGSSYAITWTNTLITSTSVIGLTIQGGTNTTQNITFTVVPGAGTATLTIYNNTAATALNGTILIGYTVL